MTILVSVPEQSYADALEGVDGIEVIVWDGFEPHERAGDVAVYVPPYLRYRPTPEQFSAMPSLRLVQLLTAGYDNVVEVVPEGVVLCNGAGIHDTSTAELALTLILASLRGVPEFVRAQDAGRWLPVQIWPALADRRALIVGYGAVGRAVAKRLKAFEVHVTGMARTARAGDDGVDAVLSTDRLPEVIGEYDVVVLITPLTEQTRGMVDGALMARMRPGALLVNMARGPVVVTDDLVQACASGHIRAAVDVTDPEPLPDGHPLWSTPGVLVSPHVGGASTAMAPRAEVVLREQVEAFVAGRRPARVVK